MGLEKIAERKKELGLTTEELSNKSGIPVGTLNKILNGTTTDPKLETVKALSRVLGLKLDCFVDNDSDSQMTIEFNDADESFIKRILSYYEKLNSIGRAEALNRLQEMLQIDKYTK